MNLKLKNAWCLCLAMVSMAAFALTTGCQSKAAKGASGAGSEYVAEFTSDGALIRPENYREWVFVGTPLTPNDMNNGNAPFPEFHSVYIESGAWKHYKETGKFREGTVLVKELISVGSKQATSGAGYFMGDYLGLEATVKSKEHFPDEPGNWAYFSFGHEYPLAETAKPFPSQSCNACHESSAADDFVFTQYYPVLRAAKEATAGGEKVHDGEQCEECKAGLEGLSAAGEAATEPSSDTPAATAGSIPTEKEALFNFLKEGKYKSFPAKESAAHPSAGPHSIKGTYGLPVQAYLNPIINASLKAGSKTHPEGSGIVKEMFSAAGELEGWAVTLKTQKESDGGKGWFWYEVTSTTDSSALVANGNGVPLCAGCHSASKNDFVLIPFPLK